VVGALSDLLSTPLGTSALSPELRAYIDQSRNVFSSVSKIPPHLSQLAASVGVQSNPYAKDMDHPLHKALEHKHHGLLHAAVNGKDYSVLSRKPLSGPLVDNASFVCNSILVGKDLLRYPNGVFAAPIVPTALCVLSDTLQMLTTADIDALGERSPDLQHILCTAPIGYNTMAGVPSYYPDYYKTVATTGGFNYYPESSQVPYFQPDHATDWLKIDRFHGRSGDWSVTILEQHCTHFLILVSRTAFLPQHVRSFPTGGWVTIPATFLPGVSLTNRRVPRSFLTSMVSFADRYSGDLRDFHAKAAQVNAASSDHVPYGNRYACAVLAYRLHRAGIAPVTFLSQLQTGFFPCVFFLVPPI
jgi:hypothetical protein